MKVLLDTYACLWFVWNSVQLSATARARIVDPNNEIYLSPANYWELAIKIRIGKLRLAEPYEVFVTREIQQNCIRILPILVSHTAVLTTLPLHHRDPFDRLLVAHAMVEQMRLVSADPVFDSYPVTRLW